MRKRIWAMMILLAFAFSLTVSAVEDRAAIVIPTLSFGSNRAFCEVQIIADHATDEITAVIKLWENGRCLDVWDAEDSGVLQFEETVDATEGKTYKLTVDAVIGGRRQPTVYTEEVYD